MYITSNDCIFYKYNKFESIKWKYKIEKNLFYLFYISDSVRYVFL